MNKKAFLILGMIFGIMIGYGVYIFILLFINYKTQFISSYGSEISKNVNENLEYIDAYMLCEDGEKFKEIDFSKIIKISIAKNDELKGALEDLTKLDIKKYISNNSNEEGKMYFKKTLTKNAIISSNDIGTYDEILNELNQNKYLNEKKIIKINYDKICTLENEIYKDIEFEIILNDLKGKNDKKINLSFVNFETDEIIQKIEGLEVMFIDKDYIWINCDVDLIYQIERLKNVGKIIIENRRTNE